MYKRGDVVKVKGQNKSINAVVINAESYSNIMVVEFDDSRYSKTRVTVSQDNLKIVTPDRLWKG